MDFWCISVFFNPAKYKAPVTNYHLFKEHLLRQGNKLLTVELAFNDDDFCLPDSPDIVRLRGSSVMWQKERLINYASSLLPKECKYFGWLDSDIIFNDDNWAAVAVERLKKADVVQLFKRVFYLPKGDLEYKNRHESMIQSVIWQKNIHRNWLERRKKKELPFSAPGFAWACRRDTFDHVGGIYDLNIVGSGDTFMVDCYLDSWDIHGYAKKFTPAMKVHMTDYATRLRKKKLVFDYVPVDIFHLWHGTMKNRAYMDRHDIMIKYCYDPVTDVRLENGVLEWNSDKTGMHHEIVQYFQSRKEDNFES